MATRLPLSPYCNPLSAGYSLGVFHRSPIQLLASFADKVSGAIAVWSLATNRDACLPFPAYPRKAGYSAHSTRFCAPQCRFISGIVQRSDTAKGVRRCTISSLHSDRVIFSMPLEIARPPQAQSPSHSIHPRLGVRSRHHGVHRYAKQRIFRPFLAAGKAD